MMANLLSIISMILCFCGGALYAVYAFFIRKDWRTPGKIFLNGSYVLLLFLLGIAFRFYYPFTRFCFLVTVIFLVCSWSGVILSLCFTSEKSRKIVQYILAGLLVFFTVAKLFFFTRAPFVGRLAFNLCNICVIFIIIQIFHKNRFLDNYIMCFGVLGAILNYLSGTLFDNAGIDTLGSGFFNIQVFESVMLHDLLLVFCIFMFTSKGIIIEKEMALKNLLWLVPMYIFFIFFNQIFKTDYFFTGVFADTPGFLIDFYYAVPLRFSVNIGEAVFEFNLLHAAAIICAASVVLFIFSYLAEFMQKRIIK